MRQQVAEVAHNRCANQLWKKKAPTSEAFL
jgi:hypothetical protein